MILSQESEVVNFSCCDEACQRDKQESRVRTKWKENELRKMKRGERLRKGTEHEK